MQINSLLGDIVRGEEKGAQVSPSHACDVCTLKVQRKGYH